MLGITFAPQPIMPSPEPKRQAIRSPAMPNGRCRMDGGPPQERQRGNRNALKQRRYTAESIPQWRRISGESPPEVLSESTRLVAARGP